LRKFLQKSASTILFLAIVAIVPALRLVGEPKRSVTLRDGTRLTLVKTSWGSEHRFGGSPLSGLVPYLPPIPRAWRPKQPRKMFTPLPSICVWIRAEGPSAAKLPGVGWEIADSSGAVVRVNPAIVFHDTLPGPAPTFGFTFASFPRRDPAFKLRAIFNRYDSASRFTEEFEMANPLPPKERRSFPVWTPEPVPAVRKAGGPKIELVRLLTTGSWDGTEIRKAKPGDDTWGGFAEFRVREGGQSAPSWFLDGVTLSDATGNSVNQGSWSHASKKETTMLLWNPGLWPDAGGWKAHFEFTRDKTATFSDAELFVVTSSLKPTATFARLGHTVKITHVPTVADPELRLQATPPLLDKQLDAIQAIDDQGRPWRSLYSSGSRLDGSYTFGFKSEPGSKELTITLALHASVYVDFHAMPVPP